VIEKFGRSEGKEKSREGEKESKIEREQGPIL
jgi:hypothetical protein